MFNRICTLYMLFAASISTNIFASTTANATINYSVDPIDVISVSGNPPPMTLTIASAGSPTATATDSTTTYAITTNNSARAISGVLASAMPTGVTLSVNLAPPTGGSSTGIVSLGTTPATLITDIANIAQGSLMITYIITASMTASQVSGYTSIVTYTIGP